MQKRPQTSVVRLLGLLAVLVGYFSSLAVAHNFTVAKVVDGNTKRPDGQGTFGDALDVSTSGSYVVWSEAGLSIWSANLVTHKLVKLADTSTSAPGGTGNFTQFGQAFGGTYNGMGIAVRNGVAVFMAFDTVGQGIYSVPAGGGAITRIVDYHVTLPNGGIMGIPGYDFYALSLTDTGYVAWNGQASGYAADGSALGAGVYSAKIDGSAIYLIADEDHLFIDTLQPPGEVNACMENFGTIGAGGDRVVYSAAAVGNNWAIYSQSETTPASGVPPSSCGNGPAGPIVTDSATLLPGDPVSGKQIPYYLFNQTDGRNAFFFASDWATSCCSSLGGGGWAGIYAVPLAGGSITKVVEDGDTLPSIGVVTNISIEFSVDSGDVLFEAINENTGANGIFLWSGGQIYKVVATGDTVTGDTVGPTANLVIWPQSYKHGVASFIWSRPVAPYNGVYIASTCAPNVSSGVSVTGGAFHPDSNGLWQGVALKNTSASSIAGPMSLVLKGLPSGVTLMDANGASACSPGDPYINVPLGSGDALAPGATADVVLYFRDPSKTTITYTTSVVAGAGTP